MEILIQIGAMLFPCYINNAFSKFSFSSSFFFKNESNFVRSIEKVGFIDEMPSGFSMFVEQSVYSLYR